MRTSTGPGITDRPGRLEVAVLNRCAFLGRTLLAGLAPGLGIEPLLLIVPAAIAASCAFMLPVATPPNAVVFGSGFVPLPQMARAGIWLNLIGIIVITGLCYALVLPLLGMSGSISG